jgi:hypothetical protein
MAKNTADNHYEEKFEFPLWKLIKERAEEKDISYVQASVEVLPEYEKGIRYRDEEFEKTEIEKRQKELAKLSQQDQMKK